MNRDCSFYYLPMPVNKCVAEGCPRRASFARAGARPSHCARHRPDGSYVNATKIACAAEGCDLFPSFAFPGEAPTYCKRHKLEGFVNVKAIRCVVVGCGRHASYGPPCAKRSVATCCARHRLEGYLDTRSVRCISHDCQKLSLYTLCREHSLFTKRAVRQCAIAGCRARPVYKEADTGRAAHQSARSAAYCVLHCPKKSEIVPIAPPSRRCVFPGCYTRPSFAPSQSNIATHCSLHQPNGYHCIGLKYCKAEACPRQASYGPPGSGRPGVVSCYRHVAAGHVNLLRRLCINPGCTKEPTFGPPGAKRPDAVYCYSHKLFGYQATC